MNSHVRTLRSRAGGAVKTTMEEGRVPGVTAQTETHLACSAGMLRSCDACEATVTSHPLLDDELNTIKLHNAGAVEREEVVKEGFVWFVPSVRADLCVDCHRNLGAAEAVPIDGDYVCECCAVEPIDTRVIGWVATVCGDCLSRIRNEGTVVGPDDEGVLRRGNASFSLLSPDDPPTTLEIDDDGEFLREVASRVSETNLNLIRPSIATWRMLSPLEVCRQGRTEVTVGLAVQVTGDHHPVAVVLIKHRGAIVDRAYDSFDEYEAALAEWEPSDTPRPNDAPWDFEALAESSVSFAEWVSLTKLDTYGFLDPWSY